MVCCGLAVSLRSNAGAAAQSPAAHLWLECWKQEWLCPLSALNCCCCWGKEHWGPFGWRAWPCDPAAVWASYSVPHTAGITAPRLGLSHGRPHSPSTLAHGASERGRAGTSVWWNLGGNQDDFYEKCNCCLLSPSQCCKLYREPPNLVHCKIIHFKNEQQCPNYEV